MCISLDLGISFSKGIYAGPIGLALCMRNHRHGLRDNVLVF